MVMVVDEIEVDHRTIGHPRDPELLVVVNVWITYGLMFSPG